MSHGNRTDRLHRARRHRRGPLRPRLPDRREGSPAAVPRMTDRLPAASRVRSAGGARSSIRSARPADVDVIRRLARPGRPVCASWAPARSQRATGTVVVALSTVDRRRGQRSVPRHGRIWSSCCGCAPATDPRRCIGSRRGRDAVVGVVGLGSMGRGRVGDRGGYETVGHEVREELGLTAAERIGHFLTRKVEKGQLGQAAHDVAVGRLTMTPISPSSPAATS